jgi:hypothetical protein
MSVWGFECLEHMLESYEKRDLFAHKQMEDWEPSCDTVLRRTAFDL